MAQPQNKPPDFASIFANPSIDRMLNELTDDEFEDFVGYVFQQAGYFVEDTALHRGPGLDLKLFTGLAGERSFHAGVQIKHFIESHRVSVGEIRDLRGGLPQTNSITGYFVTTSSFNDQALKEAEAPDRIRIWPIDGDHFLRYITYVRGSRFTVGDGLEVSSPLHRVPQNPICPEAFFAADQVKRRPAEQTTVLTLANHKGGVGKTTTALNLAFGLASDDRDKQVLLVDLDPQANLTRELPSQAPDANQTHIGEYFTGQRTLPELVRQTQFKRVWLIPSHKSLALVDHGLAAGPEAELQFVRDLHAANVMPPSSLNNRPFDWIIIDTGPFMGYFTRSAVAASHYVIMPVSPGVFSDVGISVLKSTVDTMSALMGTPVEVLGCVVTQWKDDTFNKTLLQPVEQRLKVLGDKVPFDRTNIEKAHLETGAGRKKTIFDRRCAAARAYGTVIDDVLKDVQSR